MDLIHAQRIGVLGGTFNPVHMGHLIMAQDAFELFELSRVLFIPCALPPHKERNALASMEHRLNMLHLAVEGDVRFEVSDLELRRGGISYTIDTAKALAELHPKAELFFIIGSDTLPELRLWRDIAELVQRVHFITLVRPGQDLAALKAAELGLAEPWATRLRDAVRVGHTLNVSSTNIRHRIAEGLSVRYLVPSAVEMYMAEHSLYMA